jgi:hypothetical protein
MIVGIKTERFITVQRHSDPDLGYRAFGIEETFELHATKGWKYGRRRRQLIGSCEKRDAHRAATQGSSFSFKRFRGANNLRSIGSIPITEKMLMRHGWYRRQKNISDEAHLRSTGELR